MAKSTTHLAALLPALGTDLVIQERETPTPKSDEILIRNHVIAVNPVDWKRQAWGFAISNYPVILGSGAFRASLELSHIANDRRC
jgi:NADPH:quinone reductase-like Zn-dependent oxidoreductase